jgi:hypothetical protein
LSHDAIPFFSQDVIMEARQEHIKTVIKDKILKDQNPYAKCFIVSNADCPEANYPAGVQSACDSLGEELGFRLKLNFNQNAVFLKHIRYHKRMSSRNWEKNTTTRGHGHERPPSMYKTSLIPVKVIELVYYANSMLDSFYAVQVAENAVSEMPLLLHSLIIMFNYISS